MTVKVGAWLGITVSALAVLAFFGISTAGDFGFTSDPEAANQQACKIANQAYADYSSSSDESSLRSYAAQLTKASDKAADEHLKTGLKGQADHIETMVGYTGNSWDELYDSEDSWKVDCP
ncbi:hypothetical protein [Streptomyces sp. NPDC059970]|uniref:hypothetical protein n=1 Tax=Streptomyces sp. NPDC059970 TaxID=3347019 RepID=UPI0036863012